MGNKSVWLGPLSLRDISSATLPPQEVFSHLPILKTPRLILRPMTMRDAADIFSFSRVPAVAQNVLWSAQRTLNDSKNYLRYILRQYRDGAPSSYGIVYRETGRVVGTIGFMWYNRENRSAEVGYSLARWLWNKGLMSEALSAVLEMGFIELRLHRVEAQHELTNPASGRVMEKCGMLYEGCLRGRVWNKGRFSDVALYAILRENWANLKV